MSKILRRLSSLRSVKEKEVAKENTSFREDHGESEKERKEREKKEAKERKEREKKEKKEKKERAKQEKKERKEQRKQTRKKTNDNNQEEVDQASKPNPNNSEYYNNNNNDNSGNIEAPSSEPEAPSAETRNSQIEPEVEYADQGPECINSVLSDDIFAYLFHQSGFSLRDFVSASMVSKKWHIAARNECLMQEKLTEGVVIAFGTSKSGALGLGDATTLLSPRVVKHLFHAGQKAVSAAAGEFHSIISTSEGKLWQWGDPLQTPESRSMGSSLAIPVEISLNMFVVKVAAGSNHCMAQTREGRIFAWGEGKCGQLGLGNTARQQTPAMVGGLKDFVVVDVAAGARHSLAVTDSGKAYSWGEGSWGKLGHRDDSGSKYAPTLIAEGGPAVAVAATAGTQHSLLLGKDGVVYSFGSGSYGQLGHGDINNEKTPRPILSLKGTNVKAISAGGDHSMALSWDGRLFSFGNCLFGELGLGCFEEVWEPREVGGPLKGKKVVTISAGASHSLVISEDGKVYAFGNGDHGELGYGEQINGQTEPRLVEMLGWLKASVVAAGWKHSLVVTNS